MSSETAINVPLESAEIVDILCMEFRKRLLSLSPLQSSQEYAGFEVRFNHDIKLFKVGADAGQTGELNTLAWADVKRGTSGDSTIEDVGSETYKSEDPNGERMKHDLPLTVEASDGRGGKARRKVKVKDMAK